MKLSCVLSIPNLRRSKTGRSLFAAGLIGVSLLFAGCTDRPSDLIDEETYINILVEIHILHAVDNKYEDYRKTLDMQESVLEHYDISIEKFDRSHQYYSLDTDAQRERISKARDLLNEELAELNRKLVDMEREKREEENEEDEEPEEE